MTEHLKRFVGAVGKPVHVAFSDTYWDHEAGRFVTRRWVMGNTTRLMGVLAETFNVRNPVPGETPTRGVFMSASQDGNTTILSFRISDRSDKSDLLKAADLLMMLAKR